MTAKKTTPPVGLLADLFQIQILDADEKRVIPCADEDCEEGARVVVTCQSLGRNAEALCAGHAHVLFADWMVGV